MDPEATRPQRRNVLLRMLIDDMLGMVRDMQGKVDPWTPEERARVESDLERIMSRVRSEALRRHAR